MIPEKIRALFEFIDFLDTNKTEYVEKYIPLCNEILDLDTKRSNLKPRNNYIDKQKYDDIQKEITEKCKPITQNIAIPILNKLKQLGIWDGDDIFTSIWNKNASAIYDFREHFTYEDVDKVKLYKHKYLSFRKEANSNFLSLQFLFSNLDEIFKELFDFFKDTDENEFESFEAKTIEVNNIGDAVKGFKENKGKNLKFSIPSEEFFRNPDRELPQKKSTHINNEIIMGDKFQVGDINNNSGQIAIGKNIRISDSLNEKTETADKISELIKLIRQESNINDEQKQLLITNFDKVKDELFEEQPAKPKIFKWLSITKNALENLVLSHHVTEAIHWIYKNFNFVVDQIKG